MVRKSTVREIIPLLGSKDVILGDVSRSFVGFADRGSVTQETLDWINLANKNPFDYLTGSLACVIICPQSISGKITSDILRLKTIILTPNPNLLFVRIASHFNLGRPCGGVHSTAIIHKDAIIGEGATIGAYCVIGKVIVGSQALIAPNVFIEDNVAIGDCVYIKSGAKLGQAGFGFVRNENGTFEKFPHLGKLMIGNDVEIGSNTSIDTGSLSNTVIGDGVKISGMTVIAHNVQIGKHSFVGAGVVIAGSTKIGEQCWIAPSVCIREHLSVGDNALIGLGSLVVTDVPPNEVWAGSPAKYMKPRT